MTDVTRRVRRKTAASAVSRGQRRSIVIEIETHKFTPGPWTAPGVFHGNLVYGSGSIVADVVTSAPDPGEREANATLIAAAPDMLDCLRELISTCHGDPLNKAARDAKNAALYRAASAVAKATGQEVHT